MGGSSLWAYRKWYARDDGIVWGVRSGRLYVLRPGSEEFVLVDVPKLITYVFDPFRQSMLLLLKNGVLMEWDGVTWQPGPFGTQRFGRDSVLPTYVPQLDIYVARPKRDFFAIDPHLPDEWSEIDFGWWTGPPKGFVSVSEHNFRATGDGSLVTFRTGRDLYVFGRTGTTGFALIYSLDDWHNVVVSQDGQLWAKERSGLKRAYLLTSSGAEPVAPEAVPEDSFQAARSKSRSTILGRARSDVFGGMFLSVEEGLQFIDADGGSEIVIPRGTSASRPLYVADIPGTESGLVILEDGLHLLTRDCGTSE